MLKQNKTSFFSAILFPVLLFLLWWLAVHFFVDTSLTWGLWWDRWWLALWKEILIVLLWWCIFLSSFSFFPFLKRKKKTELPLWVFLFVGVVFLLVVWSVIVHFFVHDAWLYPWVLAMKYDVFPFVVFFVSVLLSSVLTHDILRQIFRFFMKLMKVLLVVSLLWYIGLNYVPVFFGFFWYDIEAYQWLWWAAPPVRYLTNVWWWFVRNQWLFWWPVSRWFYLIAFWPFFVWSLLKDSKWTTLWAMWLWLVLYVLNVGVTFSRAAWWVFLFQSLLLFFFFILYKKRLKRSLGWFFWLSVFVWVFLCVQAISFLWPADVKNGDKHETTVLTRELSDKGHKELFLEWLNVMNDNVWFGLWAGSVGPASLHESQEENEWFNPENNYLQIAIEYGLPWLVLWLLCWLLVVLLTLRKKMSYFRVLNVEAFMLVLWLFGLGIAGMVLHPFVDAQVIYSLMLLMGMVVKGDGS